MQIGMNVMLWTASVGPEHAELFNKLRAIGYDLLELPVFAPATFPTGEVRRMLEAEGLDATGCAALPAQASLIAADGGEGERGIDFVRRCIDVCEAIGAPVLCGPLYHPVGSFSGTAPTTEEKSRYIERMQQIGDHATQAGVRLAVEPLNRFETHFINTLEDEGAVIRQIAHPAVGLHSDTFHQHIEEKNSAAALEAASDVVIHVHASENHRGCPGRGQVRWSEWADTIKKIGYGGPIVIESFGAGLPELAAATRVWRDLTGDPLVLAAEGFRFIQSTLKQSG